MSHVAKRFGRVFAIVFEDDDVVVLSDDHGEYWRDTRAATIQFLLSSSHEQCHELIDWLREQPVRATGYARDPAGMQCATFGPTHVSLYEGRVRLTRVFDAGARCDTWDGTLEEAIKILNRYVVLNNGPRESGDILAWLKEVSS